jgi:O-antigen/teichoic acid export membrane protein
MTEPRRTSDAESAELDDPTAVLDLSTAGGKVIRGSVLRTAGYVAGILLSVGSAAVMIRHLGVVDWGRYVTVVSLMTIVAGIGEAGTTSIGVREYATRTGSERETLLRSLLGLRFALTAIGIVVAVVFTLAADYPGTVVAGTAVAGVGLLLTLAQQTYAVPLTATLRLGAVAVLDLLRQALTVVAAVLLVVAGARLLAFLAIPIPVGIIVGAATVWLVRRQMPLRPAFDAVVWRRVLGWTLAYSAAAAVATVYVSITVVLTSLLASDTETGYYGASFRIFTVLAGIPLLLVGSAFPVVARAASNDSERERLSYLLQRLFEIAVIFGTWMTIATVLGAEFAIHVVAGSGFDPAVPVLQIQGVALIGTFLSVTWGIVLLSLHRHMVLLVTNVVGLATSVGLTFALVPSLGAKGAAIATLVGEFVLTGLYVAVLFVRDRLAVSVSVLPAVLAAAGGAFALALVPGLSGIALVAAASVAYFLILFAFRAIPAELLEALVQRRGYAA